MSSRRENPSDPTLDPALDPALEVALQTYMDPVVDDGFTAQLISRVEDRAATYADLPLFERAEPSALRRWSLALSFGGAVGLVVSQLSKFFPDNATALHWPDMSMTSTLSSQPSVLLAVGLMIVFCLIGLLLDSSSTI